MITTSDETVIKSFRLMEGRITLSRHELWKLIRDCGQLAGWWTVLYGIDIWINGVPIIRTSIAVNIVIWLLIWLALR